MSKGDPTRLPILFLVGRKLGIMGRLKDYTGERFGRLIVIKRVENNKHNQVRWLCKCDCGNKKIVLANALREGNTRSCGCLKHEQNYINIVHITHNKSNTRLYNIWKNMKNRCNNPKNRRHKFYYDKGIKVCNEWQKNFMSFYKWAMENGYKENLTIDRIDNNGNYEPNNCRWATITEQNNNQSNNIRIYYNNITYNVKDFCKKYKIKRCTLMQRLKNNWNIEKIINTPIQSKRSILYNGTHYTAKELAEKYHIKQSTLITRLSRNWTIDEALNLVSRGVK